VAQGRGIEQIGCEPGSNRNSTVLVTGAVGLLGSRRLKRHLLFGGTIAGWFLRFAAGTVTVK
jgi:hypothetical protein